MNNKYYKFILWLTFVNGVNCEFERDDEFKEAADCEWEGIKGKCVPPNVCMSTLDDRGDKPPSCGKCHEEYLICCTDCNLVNDTQSVVVTPTGRLRWKDGRVFRDKCLDYIKELPNACTQEGFYGGITRQLDTNKKCHTFSIWAIGGAPPVGVKPPSKNPYEALMGFGRELHKAAWVTSGVIISENFILTSAHGHTTTEGNIPLRYAALGVQSRTSDIKKWQIRDVKRIHHHPQYDGGDTRYNNIALVELKTLISFNADVLPACLPDPKAEFDIQEAKISSWKEKGMDFNTTTSTPKTLQVQKLTNKQCHDQIVDEEYPIPIFFTRFLPEGIDNDTQICYGNKDTCMNIIGSAVVVNTQLTRCMNTVIGINAYGDQCGTAVFTKVAHFLPWIENIVWPQKKPLEILLNQFVGQRMPTQ